LRDAAGELGSGHYNFIGDFGAIGVYCQHDFR
jgi:hypothetical protein